MTSPCWRFKPIRIVTELRVERIDRPGEVRLRLEGELDLAGADHLLGHAQDIPPGGALALDLSALSFMDSAGLKALMNLDRRSKREPWSLILENPRDQVRRLLELCGFDQRLPIRQT